MSHRAEHLSSLWCVSVYVHVCMCWLQEWNYHMHTPTYAHIASASVVLDQAYLSDHTTSEGSYFYILQY